jgi:hypothetical protein
MNEFGFHRFYKFLETAPRLECNLEKIEDA